MSAAFTGIERASELWPLAILVSLAFTSKKQASQGENGSKGDLGRKDKKPPPFPDPVIFSSLARRSPHGPSD